MKVLQVNVVYASGSTGRIVEDIHKGLLSKNIESVVCYGRGENFSEDANIFKVSTELSAKLNALKSRITGLQYNGSATATKKLIKIIESENPDIVHLQCINGNFTNIYKLVKYLKQNNIKTVITLHAEFMYTGSCGHSLYCEKWKKNPGCGQCPQLWDATKSYYFDRTRTAWKKMYEVFKGFDNKIVITSVSPWLMHRAMQSPILKDKTHYYIPNGIDTSKSFRYKDFQKLKDKFSLTDEKIILHVTSNLDFNRESFKGGWYILELAEKFKNDNIKIVIVGSRESHDLPNNIINVGRIATKDELASYYSLADVCILTSKRETFSMVTAESLSCGTPVVGFEAGAPEQIALKAYSSFVTYGDLEALELEIRNWLTKKTRLKEHIEKEARLEYSKENMVQKYIDIYENF